MLRRVFTRTPAFDCMAGSCSVPGCTSRSHGWGTERWYVAVVDDARRVALSLSLGTPYVPPGRTRIESDRFSGRNLTYHVGYPWAREEDRLSDALSREKAACDLLGTCWGGSDLSSALQADLFWKGIALGGVEDWPEPPERLWLALEAGLAGTVPPLPIEGARAAALEQLRLAEEEASKVWGGG